MINLEDGFALQFRKIEELGVEMFAVIRRQVT